MLDRGRQFPRARALLRHWSLALLLLGSPVAGLAQSDPPEVDPEEPPPPSLAALEEAHEAISQGVEAISLRLDRFFAGDRIYQEATGTYARFGTYVRIGESGDSTVGADLRVKLDLPNTENRFEVLLEGEPEDEPVTFDDVRDNPLRIAQDTTYSTAVRRNITQTETWDISTDAGVKFRSPLDPFARLRIRRSFLTGDWVLRATQTLFWFDSEGTGAGTRLEVERPLIKPFFFRSTSEGIWYRRRDGFDLRQSLQVFHVVSPRRGLIYEASVFGDDDPHVRAESYLLDVRYRQLIHRDWLFLEVSPQVIYERERDFDPHHVVTVTFEIAFGRPYL